MPYPFSLMPLPYPYNGLTPYIDAATVCFHHDKHLRTYVNNLNDLLRPLPQFHSWPLEKILLNLDAFPSDIRTKVKNNAGGVYNHELYFSCMGESRNPAPCGRLASEISLAFGSFESWRQKMKEAALAQFGSGYAWLVWEQKKLKIVQTANQDTPLSSSTVPLLPVDIWEHAYYLQYQNRRECYVENWFFVINWRFVEKRFESLCT